MHIFSRKDGKKTNFRFDRNKKVSGTIIKIENLWKTFKQKYEKNMKFWMST